MRRRGRQHWRVVLVLALPLGLASACAPGGDAQTEHSEEEHEAEPTTVVVRQVTQEVPRAPMTSSEIPLAGTETTQDWDIVLDRVAWAREQGLQDGSMGETVARIGETFVGDPYTPGTLEVAEPEALVVNLREFDCVTFVESVLALARVVQTVPATTTDPETLKARYIEELTHLRYRHGVIDGYPSRLHYFSEWLADNQSRGTIQVISHLMGGTEVIRPINFMSTHPDAYRQLADADNFARIREVERRLSAIPLYPIRQNRVSQFTDEIQSGDIIAATSTVDGLDVAHTGIALWVDGTLRLMHAPLVGSHVQISEEPLAERLVAIRGQDGIFVARPLEVQ